MADDVEVKPYLDHVRATVEDATDKVLAKFAMRVVEGAQLNIRTNDQVDTGFMVNSVYMIGRDESTYDEAETITDMSNYNRAGERVDHIGDLAPEQQLPSDAAAGVVVGAIYAIYQEAEKAFLYPAAERAAADFGGEAERIYREVLPDEEPR